MGTTTIDETARRRQVREHIHGLTEAVIDWDTAVDDARADVVRALEQLQRAIAHRDAAVYQLALLVAAAAA
jgi:hypothetical protein